MTPSDATGPETATHVVQLFDGPDSLVRTVSAFVLDGLAHGDAVLLAMTTPHWDAVARHLDARGAALREAASSGRLIVKDAVDLQQRLLEGGRPDAGRFDAILGTLVRQLRSDGRRLRVYGEIVDLFAGEGDYRGATQLEALWNELGRRESFTLLCGYSSANFGDPRHAAALRAVCAAHTHVDAGPEDILGAFLLESHAAGARRLTPALS